MVPVLLYTQEDHADSINLESDTITHLYNTKIETITHLDREAFNTQNPAKSGIFLDRGGSWGPKTGNSRFLTDKSWSKYVKKCH